MKRATVLAGAVMLLAVAVVSEAAEVSVKSMPPVVVNTSPQAGDTKVDPATSEIKVTFSKTMRDGSWSWSQISKETFPETAGKPHYLADKRTCVLPVKLAPGCTYVLWLNSNKFQNFKDAGGQPAVPYLLVFETGGGGQTGAAGGGEPSDDPGKIAGTIAGYFQAKANRDPKAVIDALHSAAIVVEAANPNASVHVLDLTKAEKLLPPKGNDDWIGVTISGVNAQVSPVAPSVAIASFALQTQKYERSFQQMRAHPPGPEIRDQMSQEQRKWLDRILEGKNPTLTMFALMAKQGGHWKIVAMTLPR